MDPDERLADLERRVAALESPGATGTAAVPGESGGEVGYQGAVDLAGEVSWTIRYDARAVTELPADAVADVLAALGHPVRLAIVRRLVLGPASAAELVESASLSSTGQLYHHLRALTSARVVAQDGRQYRIPASGVVPVLVTMLAAADLGGALR